MLKILIISMLYLCDISVYTLYIYTRIAKLIIFHRKREGMGKKMYILNMRCSIFSL